VPRDGTTLTGTMASIENAPAPAINLKATNSPILVLPARIAPDTMFSIAD
jgi:hypothetical protein